MPTPIPVGYQSRWNEERAWKRMLYLSGRAVQAAEYNELQEILLYEHELVTSSLYKEGAILSGTSFDVDLESMPPSVTITAGQIYAEGYVHNHPGGMVDITGVGIEQIGIVLNATVLTEEDDPILNDPQVGAENYNRPGAHRLIFTYSYAVNNPSAVPVAELIDGSINQIYDQARPIISSVLRLLAKRTFEESGHYTSQPYDVSAADLPTDDPEYDNNLRIMIKDGLAFVEGWRIENSLKYLDVARPVTTQERPDELITYVGSQTKYELASPPIRDVTDVVAQIQAGPFAMTRNPTNPPEGDAIPRQYQPVVSVVSIAGYTQGTDYNLDGTKTHILWLTGGSSPALGAQYQVTLIYNKQMVQGVRTLIAVPAEVVQNHQLGAREALANADVDRVIAVTLADGTVFNEGTDFTVVLVGGRYQLDWSGAANEPARNADYVVTYEYWGHTTEGEFLARDSFVDGDGVVLYDRTPSRTFPSGEAIDYTKEITFETAGGATPVVGQAVSYTYLHALPRTDVLAVDRRGIFHLIPGEPAFQPRVPQLPAHLMGIARLALAAEARAAGVTVETLDNQRMTMADIRAMFRLVKQTMYNQTVFQLHQEALDSEASFATDKQGVFADDFSSLRYADTAYRIPVPFDATVDSLARTMLIGQNMESQLLGHVPASTTARLIDSYFMSPYTERLLMSQPYTTGTIQANAFGRVNLGAMIQLMPAVDRWTEEIVNVTNDEVQELLDPINIRNQLFIYPVGSSRARGLSVGDEFPIPELGPGLRARVVTRAEWRRIWNRQDAVRGLPLASRRVVGGDVGEAPPVEVNTWETVRENMRMRALPNARSRPVTVRGSHFLPNEDNIACWFDGERVALTPRGATLPGTRQGTVQADASGVMESEFTVPPGHPSGSHTVEIVGSTASAPGSAAGSFGSASFFSMGRLREIDRFVTHHRQLQRRRVIEEITAVDPVAQTFRVGAPVYLTSVGVFFSRTPQDNEPIECLLVTTDNGFPTSTVLAEASFTPDQIISSTLGDVEHKFVFNHPVYLAPDKEYAFILRTDSPGYFLHFAEIGKNDPTLGWVHQNPNSGVLLVSANMRTWSAYQNSDLKFNLYRAQFSQTESIVDFGRVVMSSARSRFELASGHAAPTEDTDVIWEYSRDGTLWQVFNPPTEVEEPSQFDALHLRARLVGTERVSPVVYDFTVAQFYSWKPTGQYISRQFTVEEECRYAEVWLDVQVPGEGNTTTLSVMCELGDGGWRPMTHVRADDRRVLDGYQQRHYTLDLGAGNTGQTCRFRIDMTSTDLAVSPKAQRLRGIVLAVA